MFQLFSQCCWNTVLPVLLANCNQIFLYKYIQKIERKHKIIQNLVNLWSVKVSFSQSSGFEFQKTFLVHGRLSFTCHQTDPSILRILLTALLIQVCWAKKSINFFFWLNRIDGISSHTMQCQYFLETTGLHHFVFILSLNCYQTSWKYDYWLYKEASLRKHGGEEALQ